MTRQEFIFSNKIQHRLTRHLVFWLAYFSHVYLFRNYILDLKYLANAQFYFIRLKNLALFLPVSVFYAYFAIYYLLPEYILKGRYARLALLVFTVSVLLVLLSYQVATHFDIRLAFDMPLNRSTLVRQLDFTVSNGLVYPLTVSGFALGIKMGKNFYLQQKQNELLAKQKIDAEVLLLKSQVHPRFLFHSLHHIYIGIKDGSPDAPDMLLKLSDLLSYILYESDAGAVPLQKELDMLQNYIDLERTGWGNRLVFALKVELKDSILLIAPLLLLPVAEFIFEEADKNSGQSLCLTLDILVAGNTCRFFFCAAGGARPTGADCHENLQLLQVRKRLQALYPGRHHYAVETSQDMIAVSLSIEPGKNIAG